MIEQLLDSLSSFLPETTLTAALCVAVLTGLVAKKNPGLVSIVALAGIFGALFFAVDQATVVKSLFSGMVVVDPFAVFFKVIIGVSAVFIILFSLFSDEVQSTVKRMGEYYSLILAMTLGMFLMAGAVNLLMMVLALELTGLSSYVLAGYTKEAEDSSESALKYVLYGAMSTGLMLYGISIFYGLTGATDLQGINASLQAGNINRLTLLVASVLVIAGFGYKISAVPFHFWTPDVYEGAPVTITAFLSVASKAAGFAMMIRFFKGAFLDPEAGQLAAGMWASLHGFEWNKILAVMSVLTMTLGNLVAVWQQNIKRLLAYSSIAHAGYMLMGVVILSDKGLAAVLVYFIVYLFMNLGAFYVVMIVANKTGNESLASYKGLGYRSPVVAVAMVVFLISLTGLPPTAGFIGKLYLFAALIDAKWIWLAIVGALNSVVSLYYYVRIIRNMFLRDVVGDPSPMVFSASEIVLLLSLAVPTVLFGIYFGPITEFANASLVMFGLQ